MTQLASLEELQLNPVKVDALFKRVEREVAEGLLPATQVALGRFGKVGALKTFGTARDDSLFGLFSATKGITSAAAWLLFAEGKLAESERVADIIPEFGSNGKQTVTVEHLFTHTAGFPNAPFRPLQWNSKQETLARFAQWRLTYAPSSQFVYHPSATMWVIAEIIERRSGLSFTDFVRQRVIEPLGLTNLFVGLADSDGGRALLAEHSGDALTPDDYKKMGMPVPPETEVTEEVILSLNQPEIRAVGVPGGGGFATAADLALFYQALLHGGLNGVELWDEKTRTAARRIRSGELTDPVYRKLANRGLGIVISGDHSRNFRGFGKTNSPEAFGHNGAGGQLAWVDPATGISLAYLTSGHDRNSIREGRRGVAIGSIAAECAL